MALDIGMLMLMRGGNIDPATLNQMVATSNDKRRKIFKKIADLLFGLVMFFWSDLKWADANGVDFDPTKNQDQLVKLNAIITGLQSTNKNNLLREFLRPLIIDAAEVIAGLMEPDPTMLHLMAGQQGGGGFGSNSQYFPPPQGGYQNGAPLVHVNTAPAPVYGSAPQSSGIAAAYEGQLIMAPGDPRVFHIIGGQRHWVTNQDSFKRRGYDGNSINRNVPMATIMQIPAGVDES